LRIRFPQFFRNPQRENQQDDIRLKQARLQIVVDSLSTTVKFNPLFAVTAALVLGRPDGPFGHPPIWHLLAALAAQICSALLAAFLHRRFRAVKPEDVAHLGPILIAAQVFFSTIWGTIAWLYWVPGSDLNHVYVTMIMAIAAFSIVFARSVDIKVMVTAITIQCGIFFFRLITADGAVAPMIARVMPVYIFYLWRMGKSSNTRIQTAINARFANQDLAVQLGKARDEALKKRYEAETANASKTAFLANMSHELRTPLNAILGFSDIIASQAMGPGAVERYSNYARDIHDSGTHLLSLINDLLDIAKIEAGKMTLDLRPVDPAYMADGVVRLMVPRGDAKMQTITAEIADSLPTLMADERALRQMLLNLLSNAVKFTPAGGRITLSCEAVAGGLQFCVADNGPGIPAEKLSHVFEPFSQIDNRFDREAGGTGLGLSLVRGLARLHDGRAWLESAPGAGTRAYIYFPATSVPAHGSISLTAQG